MSVPLTRIQKLVKAISDKIPPLSQADEGILIVRLPILSAALNAAEASQVEEVVSEIDGDGGLQVAQLIEGLTEYALSDDHLPDSRNAAAACVYTLIKSGFNKNLDCPAKPLLNCINNRLSSSSDIRVARICFEFLSLIVSYSLLCYYMNSSNAENFRFLGITSHLYSILLIELRVSNSWSFIVDYCRWDCSIPDGSSMRRLCKTSFLFLGGYIL